MGNSLQDQLLKAGLANNKQAVRARKAKHNKHKLQATGVAVVAETELLVQEADREKVERDRALNLEKQKQMESRAIQAQIRQLIELNRITERGEIEFSYTHGSVIKTLMLSAEHRKALVNGRLSIVEQDGREQIVPRAVAEKIAERDTTLLVLSNYKGSDESDDSEAVEDEYSDYQVPDDLMW